MGTDNKIRHDAPENETDNNAINTDNTINDNIGCNKSDNGSNSNNKPNSHDAIPTQTTALQSTVSSS